MEVFRAIKGEIINEILKAKSSVKSGNEDKLLSRTKLAQMLGVSKASIAPDYEKTFKSSPSIK